MRRFLACTALLVGLSHWGFSQTYLVVPFENTSADPSLAWIGESIAEAIGDALVYGRVAVPSRQEREDAARELSIPLSGPVPEASLMRLGAELEAQRIVYGEFHWIPEEGSSSPAHGQIRIRARLIDLARVARGPDIEEQGAMANLVQVQTEVAWKVLRNARPDQAPSQDEFLAAFPPVRIDAMENYVRGLLAAGSEQKHRFFAQAARLAPEFPPPRFQLGIMQWDDHRYRAAAQWLETVPKTDAHYLEAVFLLGLCRYHTADYAGSLEEFRLVADRLPLPAVYNNIGIAEFRQRDAHAVASLGWAAEVDPSDPDYQFNLGYVLWRSGDLDAAVERFRAVLALNPADAGAREFLDRCLQQNGPRRGDLSSEGLERLKEDYQAIAFRRAGPGAGSPSR